MALADIWAAIQSVTSDVHDRMTLLYATAAESGAQPIAQIGGGPGMGYYQIESGQGVSQAQANDPYQATQIFYNRWPVHACATQQGQLWQTDPDAAANNAARCAEGAAGAYGPAQRNTQRSLWAQVTGGGTANSGDQLGLPFIPGIGSLPDPGGIVSGAVNDAIHKALGAVGDVVIGLFSNHEFWIRALLTVGGLAVTLIGIKGIAGIEAVPVPVPV